MAEKSRNPPSVFGGSEDAEHEFVARFNDRKEKMKKSAKPNDMLKQDVKYDSDSSVPSSFRSDRCVVIDEMYYIIDYLELSKNT